MPESAYKILTDRMHPAIKARSGQIRINFLAVDGGRPYVDARLSRWPGEPDINFYGFEKSVLKPLINSVGSGKHIDGRLDRTSFVNHVGRVVGKITEHCFSKPPTRQGVDEDFDADADRRGNSANDFMKSALKNKLTAGWVWLQVDMPPADSGLSLAAAKASKFRPYWIQHDPRTVVDWQFSNSGGLEWVLTESTSYQGSNPFKSPSYAKTRTLHTQTETITYLYNDKGEIFSETTNEHGLGFMPWVPFGNISQQGYWLDDVEGINRTIMNLSSAADDSVYLQMYGQLILPAGLPERVAGSNTSQVGAVVQTILGMNTPIAESPEEKGISRYISPNGADIKLIYDAIGQKKRDLFERVGMALKSEGKQAESAEAKSLDKNDESAILRNCAQETESAEKSLVEFSRQFDPSFPEYSPQYNREFSSQTLTQDISDALGLQSLNAPESAQIAAGKAAFEAAREKGFLKVTDEEFARVMEDFNDLGIEETMPSPI